MDLAWAKEAPSRRQFLLGGGHLAAVWAIAFVQPLLDLLGKNPDFFIARGNTPGDILILAFGFTLGPPLVMLALEWVAKKISSQLYYGLHFLLLAGILTFLFVQLFSDIVSNPTFLLVLISLAVAALLAYAVFKVAFLKNLMDILVIAPVVILLLFIFASDSSKAIFPEKESVDIGAKVDSTTPVVMVVLDELGTSTLMTEDGKIDGQRFPHFARLAKESTWYPNHSTTAYFTPTAVPGLLTGSVPPEDALPTAADQPNNIFSLLSGSYDFHVSEPITQICPESLCPEEKEDVRQLSRLKSLYSDLKYVEGRLVLPPRIADTLPDVGTNFENFGGGGDDGGEKKKNSIDDLFVKGRGGGKMPSEYSDFIRKIPGRESTMTMMHIKQPHQPWKFSADGVQYNRSPIEQLSESTGLWKVDENGVASAQQRMIVQTGFADNLVGEVIDRLKSTGIWDEAMVVVTADHGIDFQGGDVPQRMAGTESLGQVANPPLFIKHPGQKKGEVDPVHSMTLDVVPTIARELGVENMYEAEGFPLQGQIPERDVTVKDVKNRTFSLPIEDVVEQRDAAVAEKDRRFGTGPIYTLGPAPQLIGNAAPGGSGSAVTLDQPGIWDNYRPGKGLLPMNVTGTLEGVPVGSVIAVAVNGRVRGTTKSFEFEGAHRFGTLVDPSSLKKGANQISVYRVAGGQRLTPLGGN